MSSKVEEVCIRVKTSDDRVVMFPMHMVERYCSTLSKIYGSVELTSDESDEEDLLQTSAPPLFTVTRGTADDVIRVKNILLQCDSQDFNEVEFLNRDLSDRKIKGMLFVAEDFGIKMLSTLLCTKFVETNATLDTIYDFLDRDTKDIKDIERAAFKTTMTSGIPIPKSCANAWPMLSTTPSSIYSKWQELKVRSSTCEGNEAEERERKSQGLAFASETLTLISTSGDAFVVSSKLACELSAHLCHLVNLSDKESDGENSESDDDVHDLVSQKIALPSVSSNVLQCFLDYAKLYVVYKMREVRVISSSLSLSLFLFFLSFSQYIYALSIKRYEKNEFKTKGIALWEADVLAKVEDKVCFFFFSSFYRSYVGFFCI